ncbi:MAG: hypothetical protein ACJAY8_000085 [Sphingobacteriales bacterium]|jgi:hypothetical protein
MIQKKRITKKLLANKVKNALRFMGVIGFLIVSMNSVASSTSCGVVVANAGSDRFVCFNSETTLTATASGGVAPYSYLWSSGETAATIVVSPAQTTTFQVTITDNNGNVCQDEVDVTVGADENQVSNAGFETTSSGGPLLRGDIEKADNWKSITGNADLFDEDFDLCFGNLVQCSQISSPNHCIGIPCNHFGYLNVNNQNGNDGEKYAGLWASAVATNIVEGTTESSVVAQREMVEGISTEIDLTPGSTYNLSLYVAKSQYAEIGGGDRDVLQATSSSFKVILSEHPRDRSELFEEIETNNGIYLNDYVIYDNVNSENWQLKSYNISPNVAYKYIYIQSRASSFFVAGSFDPMSQTAQIDVETALQSYMYLDDVRIDKVCSCSSPVADAGPDVSVCQNSGVSIGGSPTGSGGTAPYSYYWTPGVSINSQFATNPVVNPNQTTVYKVEVTDAEGCVVKSDEVTVSVNDLSLLVEDVVEVCQYNYVEIGSLANGGVGPYNYVWTPSTNIVDPNAGTTNYYAANDGVFNYDLTVTDAVGCSKTKEVTITVKKGPLSNAGSDITICQGTNGVLNGVASGGDGNYGYLWSGNSIVSSRFQPSTNVRPSTTAVYTLKVEDGSGCFSEDQVTVTVNPRPDWAGIKTEYHVCAGDNVIIGQVAVNGTAPYVYDWSSGYNAYVSAQNTPTVNYMPTQTEAHYLYVTDAKGCSNARRIVVISEENPFVFAGDDFAICQGNDAELGGVNPVVGGSQPYSYTWSSDNNVDTYDGFWDNSQTATKNPRVKPTITTIFTLNVEDVWGCTGSDAVEVTVATGCNGVDPGNGGGCGAKPIANAGVSDTYCIEDIVILGSGLTSVSGGQAPYNYVWSPSTHLNNPNIARPTLNPDPDSEYIEIYELKVVDNCGRTATSHVRVEFTSPVANAGYNRVVCEGKCTLIGNYIDPTFGTGTPAYAYSWTTNNTTPNPPNSGRVVVCPSETTVYTLQVTDENNCISTDQVTVTVNDNPTANAGPDLTICDGDPGQQIGTLATGGNPPYNYVWSPPFGLSATNIAKPTANPPNSRNYGVVVTDSKGCWDQDYVFVEVVENPFVKLEDDVVICKGDIVELRPLVENGSQPYIFSWNPSTFLTASNQQNVDAQPDYSINYALTVTTADGCTGQDSRQIDVIPSATVNAGPDITICEGECINIGASATGGIAPYNYWWDSSPNQGMLPSSAVINVCPTQTTLYTLHVLTGNQCEAIDEVLITVNSGNNLVVNGSFESINPTPDFIGQVDRTANWNKSSGDGELFNRGYNSTLCLTPLSPACVGVPDNHFGNREHVGGMSGGDSYVGLWAAVGYSLRELREDLDPFIPSYIGNAFDFEQNFLNGRVLMEGISSELSGDIDPSQTYVLEMDVSLAQNSFLGTPINTSADFNVKFSTIDPTNDLIPDLYNLYMPNTSKSLVSGSVNSTSWVHKTFLINGADFPNSSNRLYLIVESDIDDLSLQDLNYGNRYQSYFYLDNVSLKRHCIPDNALLVDAGSDLSMCPGGSVNLSATASGGTAPYNYAWTPTTSLTTPALSNTVANPSATITYTITVTDANGEQASDDVLVTVSSPVANAGPDHGICSVACLGIGAAVPVTGGTPPYVYQWTNIGMGSIPGQQYTANPAQVCPGSTTTYQFTTTDSDGCSDVDYMVFEVYNSTNHITNGSFENGSNPKKRGDFNNVIGWNTLEGAPDLFWAGASCIDPCGNPPLDPNCVDIPCNYVGKEDVLHGDRYVGIGATVVSPGKYASIASITSKLVGGPLDPNKSYTLKFSVSLAEGLRNVIKTAPYDVNGRYGIGFSTSLIDISNKPDPLYTGTVSRTNGWDEVIITFQPTDSYEYIYIQGGGFTAGTEAYVYLDSVSLKEVCGSYLAAQQTELNEGLVSQDVPPNSESVSGIDNMETNRAANFQIFPNPNNGVFEISYNPIDLAGTAQIEMYNSLGQIIFSQEVNKQADFQDGKMKINLSDNLKEFGMIYLLIRDNGENFTKRVLIEK